ncbi:hypothetical protein GOZ80_23025 [Agrobacterium vitis]|uniref:Uncharacterized protein n=3 Tax=Rhizobiaceae TaxID=82115 RepID=A0A6I4ETQ3_AGRVI|nr:hypothetical protein [Allorhizobium ampelinum]MCF1501318.1 hypothetical protein [Allorhizobium sp. Av2]MCM2442967.1 hypothetical protein [Agrobacterium vitis]MCM2476241.1 hypothetical protein [Rhizobium sp. CG5]MCF1484877.1 hypothetical protein [Allorhizobium ampelinum]
MKRAPCQTNNMRFMKVIHRLLFVTAVLGIIVGPIGIQAADSAMAASGPAAMDSLAGVGMPDDMPCCPDEQPSKPDCGSKSCPLAVLCTTAMVGQVATSHSWLLNVGWTAYRFLTPLHAELASSLVDPPVRPPRL